MTKVLHHLACLIAGIVIHNQDFPRDGVAQPGGYDAFEGPGQAPAAIIRTQNDRDAHAAAHSSNVCQDSSKHLQLDTASGPKLDIPHQPS
jgi:hypothetical protein